MLHDKYFSEVNHLMRLFYLHVAHCTWISWFYHSPRIRKATINSFWGLV